jgi:hypothetical protein
MRPLIVSCDAFEEKKRSSALQGSISLQSIIPPEMENVRFRERIEGLTGYLRMTSRRAGIALAPSKQMRCYCAETQGSKA